MSGITTKSAFGKQQKINKDLRDEFFVTGQKIGSNRRALDTIAMGYYLVADDIIEAGSDDNLVNLTAHGARVGDFLRINTSANGIAEFEVSIDEIVDANSFRLGAILSASLAAGDTVSILRPVGQRMSNTGATLASFDPAPINFRRNGTVTEVSKDTVTPANTRGLPVEVVGANGENLTFNIAGDANMAISHTGPNPDSTQVGDGTRTLGITANNEAKTHDADALAQLVLLVAKDFSTAAKQDLAKSVLDNILTALGPLSTAAKQDAAKAVLDNILTALGSQATAANQTASKTVLDNILLAFSPLSTSAKQDAAKAVLDNILTALGSVSTSTKQDLAKAVLDALSSATGTTADAAVTSPGSAASVIAALKGILTLITSTNTKIDSLQTALAPAFSNHQTQNVVGSTTFTAPAGARQMVIQNSLEAVGPVRIVPNAATPGIADGFYLGVGQSTAAIPAGSFKAICTDGTSGDVSVMWFV